MMFLCQPKNIGIDRCRPTAERYFMDIYVITMEIENQKNVKFYHLL